MHPPTLPEPRFLSFQTMKTKTNIFLALAATTLTAFAAEPQSAKMENETRYLGFQIFTNYSSDPKDAQAIANGMREPLVPGAPALRDYVLDIKQRIGIVGDRQTRLAFMLGPLCFDQTDAEVTQFIERAFDLALETDLAVGFHIDDCIFWSGRKDLWSDPQNVEALDWDGTPSTGRMLNYGKTPMEVAPQMCFNSRAVQNEVRQRAALIGKAIAAGVKKLEQRKRPEMFAGVISGWETQMGSDLKTGKYLGYRALLNRGFSREHPPQNQSFELEKVTEEFIELWTTGLVEAGAPPQKIYSHIAFLSHRAFGMGENKQITYMKPDKGAAYSQHNHYTPPSVAFGKNHRPGFSTYPQPGLFEDIYEELDQHKQVGWASSEGTNMQPGTGPGQTGMNMETYLAKMFNHGATLTDVFSWGIGGERMKNMNYRLCTEGEEELKAYRKFLRGEPLIEGVTVAGLQERLPPKIQKIQKELPAWMQKTGNQEAAALMQKMQEQLKAKDWLEVEKTADAILKMMGVSAPPSAQGGEDKLLQPLPSSPLSDDPTKRLTEKVERIKAGAQKWAASGRDPSVIAQAMEQKFKPLMEAGKIVEAEAELDHVLEQLNKDAKSIATAGDAKQASDPFATGSFPPELVLLAQDRIALTPEQLETFRARVAKTPGAAVAVKDLLTPEQMAKLGELGLEITKNHAVFVKLEEETGKRISAKAERVKAGAQMWADSGRDPSAITKVMEEKFKPLMKADKVFEAEAELDRALKLLGLDGKSTESPTASTESVRQRVAAKVERVKEGAHQWAASGRDPSAIAKMMEEKVRPLLETGKFDEAEAELDRVLEKFKSDEKSTVSPTAAPTHAAPDITEEVREKLAHNIGISFLLFRTKVQGELKVTTQQKAQLDQHLRELLPDAIPALQKSKGEQAKYNQKTHEEMAAVLKNILNESQRTRLHQLELQKDGLFGPGWNMKELQITDEQRQQFVVPTQETQKKSQALMAEIQKGVRPDEIRPKALQLRRDLEVQLEALLTDAQKKQWKEMLGQPVPLDVIYGGL